MQLILFFCVLLTPLLSAWSDERADVFDTPSIKRYLRGEENQPQNEILCHAVVVDTLYSEEYNVSEERQEPEVYCIPLVDGHRESAHMYSITASSSFFTEYRFQLESSKDFYLRLSNVTIEGSEITLDVFSSHQVVEPPQQETTGIPSSSSKSVAIIRVNTRDSSSSRSVSDLEAMFDRRRANFVTQYEACSKGHLVFTRRGVYDIKINKNVAEFDRALTLVNEAVAAVAAQEGLSSGSEIADHTLVCLPPGTPGDWLAKATMNSWMTWYNDEWCNSLSAIMHEVGHNLGMPHSDEGDRKRGDTTGYLGLSTRSAEAPLRCFNGLKNHQMGWYSDHEAKVVPAKHGTQTINLAAFADISKTTELVLLNVADTYFVQYNRAKGMNVGTGEKHNKVTITTKYSQGSMAVGGLGAGDTFSGNGFMIKACRTEKAENDVDSMVVSIGLGSVNCSAVVKKPPPVDDNDSDKGTDTTGSSEERPRGFLFRLLEWLRRLFRGDK